MSRTRTINALALFVVGIIFVFGNYVIVIGQTAPPALAALNEDDITPKGKAPVPNAFAAM